ncbi:hypothetical protein [Turneriella parva]|uniref:Uncharacterized protein n=1 Tax=Turneriella parva (strain ATCC BAA-1111 / DSM 21527 / NCTC 11395 / H) TaxID=869212 RepID=I4B3V3_TURPD|nr:hypothetical protein [Turneriella parva]AFM11960.1 hypothetical protein Turpa_1312 [Turneriella parva DSM 21527]
MTSAWLKDSRFDLSFIFGIALLAGAMAGVTVVWPLLFLTMLAAHSWLFGYEHLWATYSNLLIHRDDRRRHRRLIFFVPPFVLLGLWVVAHYFGLTGIYFVYFIGQFHHTVRQSWGLAQRYRRAAGGLPWDNVRLSELTLWSVPVWGLLHRCSQRPTEFLFQDFWLPPVPVAAVNTAAALSLTLSFMWIYTRIKAFRRGELALGHTLYMLTHFAIFFCGYVLIDEICSGWLLVNVWHNVQYIVYVWLFNQRRFAQGVDNHARWLSWLSQPGMSRVLLYAVVTIGLALPFYYLLPLLGVTLDALLKNNAVPIAVVLSLTLTFHHYIVDAIIWRRSKAVSQSLSQATESAALF